MSESATTYAGTPRRSKDTFSTVVYILVGVAAAIEFFSLFWMDLF